MIAITGASGQLGHLVIEELLKSIPAERIIALARTVDKASDLAEQGVLVRHADYDKPETLDTALQGVTRLLLISSSEVGKRTSQHKTVIEAAKKADVELIAYTSILHADTSPLGLAEEHKATESMLAGAGLSYTLLRNGWYTENYTDGIPGALERGTLIGSAGNGRIASAARADYAAAAAAVLTGNNQAGKTYELAGDDSYTLSELAEEVSHQTGRPFTYTDMSESDFKAALIKAGLPEAIAAMLADSSAGAAKGGLYDDDKQLSQLIERPTTSWKEMVRNVLASTNTH